MDMDITTGQARWYPPESPLVRRKLRRADVARAIGVEPSTIRNWTNQIGSCSEAPVDGWREYSVVDVAMYSLVRVLTRLGMAVDEAADFAHLIVLGKSLRILSYRNTPDRVLAHNLDNVTVVAWHDGDEWQICLDHPDQDRPAPAASYAVIHPGQVVGDALDRLEGHANA